MTTTWSFGRPANLPVMPPYLPFHGRRAVAVAEDMRTNASRGSVVKGSRFHQGYEGKNHNHERSVCFLDVFFLKGGICWGGIFKSVFV